MPSQTIQTEVGYYKERDLSDFVSQVFMADGVSEKDAKTAAEYLLRADKARIWSHGINRLPVYHLKFKEGTLNPKPNIKIARGEGRALQNIDGDNGCGLVVGPWANERLAEAVDTYDFGIVTVYNSNHFGSVRHYALKHSDRKNAAFGFTNTTPCVAPKYGKGKWLGTNPITMAFPTKSYPAIIGDMATPTVAVGKLEMYKRLDLKAPYGWLVDTEGNPSHDPNDFWQGGALVGIGGTDEGSIHKGTSLATLVECLSAMGGSAFGPFVPPFQPGMPHHASPSGIGTGHFLQAFNPLALNPDFLEHMDKFVEEYRKIPAGPEGKKPLLTGDPEWAAEAEADTKGYMIPTKIMEAVGRELAQKTGILIPRPSGIEIKVLEY